MVAVTFSIPSNILLPSPLKAFIYEHSRQKVAAVAVEKKVLIYISTLENLRKAGIGKSPNQSFLFI